MEPSDAELVRRVRRGSAAAFEALMRRHERMVERIAFGMTRDRDAALDVAQTTFLKVHAGLDGWRGECEIRTWIARIATHEAANWNRTRERRAEASLEPVLEAGLLEGLPAAQERWLDDEESLAGLHRALAALGTRQRTALVLRYFLGFSARDIGAVLDCSEGTARNVLFRGLSKLRESLRATEVVS